MPDLRIGGSRASSILGVGFQTPFQVWAEMTGRVQREDIGGLEHIEAGIFLEDAAARWFAHRTGLKVLDSPGLIVDQQFPWLAGTPDRAIILADGTPGILEVKNTGAHARALWSDGEDGDVPLGYRVQVQTYLRITGYEVGYYAAIVGGQKLRTPRMERDSEFIAAMLAELERFLVEHVQADIPPAVSGDDLGVLKRMWPKDTGRSISASHGEPATQALAKLVRCKCEIAALEKGKNEAEAIVKAVMQDATELVTPAGIVTWKAQVSEFKAQPARTVEMRVLRTREQK